MSEFRQPALKELTEQLAGTDKRKSLVPVGKRRAQFERAGTAAWPRSTRPRITRTRSFATASPGSARPPTRTC